MTEQLKGKKKDSLLYGTNWEKRQLLINQIRKQFGLIESSGKQFLPHRHNHRTENNTIGRREQQNNKQLCWTYLNMLLEKKNNIRRPFVFLLPFEATTSSPPLSPPLGSQSVHPQNSDWRSSGQSLTWSVDCWRRRYCVLHLGKSNEKKIQFFHLEFQKCELLTRWWRWLLYNKYVLNWHNCVCVCVSLWIFDTFW